MQTNFVYKVYQIYQQNYVDKNKLIAISLGHDSILLSLLLTNIELLFNRPINFIHCNHFYQKNNFFSVKETFKLTFLVKSSLILSIPIYQVSTETSSRIWRQRLFKRSLNVKKIKNLFLAHTQTDKIETFIFNLLRGTSLTGSTNSRPQIIKIEHECFNRKKNARKLILKTKKVLYYNRPLLKFSRSTIKQLNKTNLIPYSIDKTNLSSKFSRNKIRLIILPLLKIFFHKNVEKQFQKFLLIGETESQYFEDITNKVVGKLSRNSQLTKNEFFKLPRIFQYRVLIDLLKIYSNREISFNLITKLITLI